jgi:dynein heavy chain
MPYLCLQTPVTLCETVPCAEVRVSLSVHAYPLQLLAYAQVSVHLARPDIVIQPPLGDVKKALARLAACIVEGTKSFTRWMDGTCLEAAPIPGRQRFTGGARCLGWP